MGTLFCLLLYSGSLLFLHQAPQVGKESGAEGEEETTLDNAMNDNNQLHTT